MRLLFVLNNIRFPWRIKILINYSINAYFYFFNKICNFKIFKKTEIDKKKIIFKCGFHGRTGGAYAIASIANLLSKRYDVEFISYPSSEFNKLLENSVKIVNKPYLCGDLYICDVSCELYFLKSLKKENKPIIISCHGFLYSSHGLTPNRVMESLYLADKVHFVSQTQQESFQLSSERFFIIPNSNKRIIKRKMTNNVGIIGDWRREEKNVKEGVELALKSIADKVYIWGSEEDIFNNKRIIVRDWENNKNKIYNSFDILVSLSKSETFGLVVIESLSAGIPCVLSDIPAFRQFEKCQGVALIDSSRNKAVQDLNDFLSIKSTIYKNIIQFWEENYSEEAILRQWIEKIEEMFLVLTES